MAGSTLQLCKKLRRVFSESRIVPQFHIAQMEFPIHTSAPHSRGRLSSKILQFLLLFAEIPSMNNGDSMVRKKTNYQHDSPVWFVFPNKNSQVLRGDWDEESGESTPKRQPMTKAKSNPQVPNNATGEVNKNCKKRQKNLWGILTSEMVFLKIEFGWYVMYVVWMVCDECFPILCFQRFITQVMGPLSHPLTSAWVQPFSTKVHLWLEWLGHCDHGMRDKSECREERTFLNAAIQ